MRILYHNTSLGLGIGGGTHAREMLRCLRAIEGTEVDVSPAHGTGPIPPAASGAGRAEPRGPARAAAWQTVARFWVRPVKREWRALRARLLARRYDVLLFRSDLRTRLLPLAARGFPRMHVCAEINALVHDELPVLGRVRQPLARAEMRLFRAADSMVCKSRFLRDRLTGEGRLDKDRVLVLPNGVNVDVFDCALNEHAPGYRDAAQVPREAFVLGYVGGMEPFRRLPEMTAHVARYLREDARAMLLLVGDGTDRDRVAAVRAGLPEDVRRRIRCVGRIDYGDVPRWTAMFDLALFPYSNLYGSPQKLFEYLAMRKPAIGPDVPPVRDVFTHGEHLWLVPPAHTDLASTIRALRDDPAAAAAMARRGYEHVVRHHTWRHSAERLSRFLAERLAS